MSDAIAQCAQCGDAIDGSRGKRYCSVRCRETARKARYRARVRNGETVSRGTVVQQLAQRLQQNENYARDRSEIAQLRNALADAGQQLQRVSQERIDLQRQLDASRSEIQQLVRELVNICTALVIVLNGTGALERIPSSLRGRMQKYIQEGNDPWQ